ncbi:hypothetical protein JW877_04945 [bacterium]|nr:hypothetical protein [bacterium]
MLKKTIIIALVSVLTFILTGFANPLSSYVPGEPLLYLELRDLTDFIEDIKQAEVRKEYQESANFQDFTHSKLYLKLQDRFKELSALSELKIDLEFLGSLGSGPTGFALYDIGNLEFFMVTSVNYEKWIRSKLYDKTKYFEPRTMGEVTYFVRQSNEGSMVFAFCEVGKLVFITNNISLLEAALSLPHQQDKFISLQDQDNFKQFEEVLAKSQDWEFFLYLKQAELNHNQYFKTYWIYQNPEEIEWIDRALIFFDKNREGLKETRYFSSLSEFPKNLPTLFPLIEKYSFEHRFISMGLFEKDCDLVFNSFWGEKKEADKFYKDFCDRLKPYLPDYYIYLVQPHEAEPDLFIDLNKALLIHMGKGDFEPATWLKLIADHCNQQFLVSPELHFSKLNSTQYMLEVPMMESYYVEFRDHWIVLANDKGFLQKLTFSEPESAENPVIRYLELDYDYTSAFLLSLIRKLDQRTTWTYYDSREFFMGNFSSLIQNTRKIKYLTLQQTVYPKLIKEEVNYLYSR